MTYIIKKIFNFPVLLLVTILVATAAVGTASAADIEEGADTIMNSDYIVTGTMNDYSKTVIVLDGIRYGFCDNVIIFSPGNRIIPLRDLDAAEEVKLFENRNCIRKIKVFRFAQ